MIIGTALGKPQIADPAQHAHIPIPDAQTQKRHPRMEVVKVSMVKGKGQPLRAAIFVGNGKSRDARRCFPAKQRLAQRFRVDLIASANGRRVIGIKQSLYRFAQIHRRHVPGPSQRLNPVMTQRARLIAQRNDKISAHACLCQNWPHFKKFRQSSFQFHLSSLLLPPHPASHSAYCAGRNRASTVVPSTWAK